MSNCKPITTNGIKTVALDRRQIVPIKRNTNPSSFYKTSFPLIPTIQPVCHSTCTIRRRDLRTGRKSSFFGSVLCPRVDLQLVYFRLWTMRRYGNNQTKNHHHQLQDGAWWSKFSVPPQRLESNSNYYIFAAHTLCVNSDINTNILCADRHSNRRPLRRTQTFTNFFLFFSSCTIRKRNFRLGDFLTVSSVRFRKPIVFNRSICNRIWTAFNAINWINVRKKCIWIYNGEL